MQTLRPPIKVINGHRSGHIRPDAAPPPIVTVHPGQAAAAATARERIEGATTAAYCNGHAMGERTGYIAGWRIGLGYGLSYGTLLGGMAGAAVVELIRWAA